MAFHRLFLENDTISSEDLTYHLSVTVHLPDVSLAIGIGCAILILGGILGTTVFCFKKTCRKNGSVMMNMTECLRQTETNVTDDMTHDHSDDIRSVISSSQLVANMAQNDDLVTERSDSRGEYHNQCYEQ